MRPGSAAPAGGFTYMGLLLAIASAAAAVAGGAYLLANDLRRDRELDLLFAGDEIRRAIEAYHVRNGAGVDPYPKTLDALLKDPHQPNVVRHLRRVRRDPMADPAGEAPSADTGGWVLIRDAQGQVIGVHSGSTQAPLKRAGFPKPYEAFAQARSYADWKFIAAGALEAPPAPAAAAGSFIPSPFPSSSPLVPAARGVPAVGGSPPGAAAPVTAPPAAGGAPAAPLQSPVIPNPPREPAVPSLAPVAQEAPPAPPPAAPPASPPQEAPAPPAAAAAPSSGAAPPASAGAPPPAPAAPAPPAVPPSLQGDGPQPFQIRSF